MLRACKLACCALQLGVLSDSVRGEEASNLHLGMNNRAPFM